MEDLVLEDPALEAALEAVLEAMLEAALEAVLGDPLDAKEDSLEYPSAQLGQGMVEPLA